MDQKKTTERAITCRWCRYYGLPNVVRTMNGRKAELYCFRCGNLIRHEYVPRKLAKELYQK